MAQELNQQNSDCENMQMMKRKMAKVTIIFLAIQSGRGVGNQRSPDSDEGDLTAAELKEL